ncbi:fructose-bisphosphate aldolase class I [Candidatus Parcubacteria bacterium]|nr:fructose-bisphosphate aldolase class I [Candidatus Parcubacteria bacterium]
MDTNKLQQTIEAMMAPGKGILAIDESTGTANKKRLEPLGIEGTEENRRRFRELFLTVEGVENHLSGTILYDETMRQSDTEGRSFLDILKEKGIAIGIKVDSGAKDREEFPGEQITSGLGDLSERLDEYVSMGAVFCKWRAVVKIDEEAGLPTDGSIRENSKILARYAEMCQQKGLVPMVEPEVLLQGKHSIDKSAEALTQTLGILFEELNARGVYLPGVVLKTSMVVPGSESGEEMIDKEVAEKTVDVLLANAPHDLGGVVFLSGGQSHVQATKNLNEIAKREPLPWPIAFSYARAIQGPVLEVWQGKDENKDAAIVKYMEVLKEESLADQGLL